MRQRLRQATTIRRNIIAAAAPARGAVGERRLVQADRYVGGSDVMLVIDEIRHAEETNGRRRGGHASASARLLIADTLCHRTPHEAKVLVMLALRLSLFPRGGRTTGCG